MSTTLAPVQQFIRKAQLVLTPDVNPSPSELNPFAGNTSNGLTTFKVATPLPAIDLSDLHFRFNIVAADTEAPDRVVIRVYNLGKQTVNTLIQEYTGVVLQAGYRNGNYGIVFQGSVTQYHRGKEDNVDSYLEIHASDGDEFYNYGYVGVPLPAGASMAQTVSSVASQIGAKVDKNALDYLNYFGGVLPRGQVQLGLARNIFRSIAITAGARWSIQNGTIKIIPNNGYLPGEAVVINSTTGMVGVPEATDNGVNVRALLNANIQVGQRIQINERDITFATIKSQFYPNYNSIQYVANVTRDGFYRVMVAQHSGDTRDTTWYTDIICLAVDPTAAINPLPGIVGTLGTVQPYGGGAAGGGQ